MVNHRLGEIKRMVGGGAALIGALAFPPTCAGCRKLVVEPGTLCAECWRGLAMIERPYCEVLGIPFVCEMGEKAVCLAALTEPPPFARARAAVAYDGVARRLVQGLKFRDRTDLAPWMARWMARAGAELLDDADMIVPVPLHRRRFLLRRFNQAAELGRAIALRAGLAFEPELVLRARSTRQQVGLGLAERRSNVRGAFAVPPGRRALVKGRRVLVVDDVYTTGATVSAVARALVRAGAEAVDVLTFARVLSEDFRDDAAAPI